jgi:ABC-2 type transport system ATP-binding protein
MEAGTVSLEARNLTKRFGSLTAVDHLSLQVLSGEVFGLLGPNGAGKTTTINLLCGLLRPDEGQVFIHGAPSGPGRALHPVGVCPQGILLWGTLTCLEQIEFIGEMYDIPRKVARRRGEVLLEALGLSEKRHKLANTLSGGMQRRLNLVLALVHDPEILVLDEPEAGLDPQSRVLVRDYVRSLARQKTILLTTHNMDEADRMADRVAIIDHGRLLLTGTPAELKRSVGEGDVLEVEVSGVDIDVACRALAAVGTESVGGDHTLVVRSRAIVERIPQILAVVRSAGGQVGEVRLRANSLEDVFISLTGRKLRE